MNEDLDFPYIYDDKEDYYTNIDYTSDVTFAPPPSDEEILLGPQRYFSLVKSTPIVESFMRSFLGSNYESLVPIFRSLEILLMDVLLHSFQAFGMVTVLLFLANGYMNIPGHKDSQTYPIYTWEHYGKRNSQHLLDPYSFVHFGHGILSYYLFSFLDGENGLTELLDERVDKTINKIVRRYKRNDEYHDWNQPHSNRNEKQIQNSISGGAGLFATLVSALVFEVAENSEMVIDTFRKNSGTSQEYRGDSQINVIGDLASCALGYNTARYLSVVYGSKILPLAIFLLTEFFLVVFIRDNMVLMMIQILYPFASIKRWQQEIIPNITKIESDANGEDEILKSLVTRVLSDNFISKNVYEMYDVDGNNVTHPDEQLKDFKAFHYILKAGTTKSTDSAEDRENIFSRMSKHGVEHINEETSLSGSLQEGKLAKTLTLNMMQ